jgi:hypothetical protein
MIRIESFTAGQLVSNGPVMLHGVMATGLGSAGYVEVFDGPTENARRVLRIATSNAFSLPFILGKAVPFKNGLYVKPSVSTVEVTVAWDSDMDAECK